MGYYVEIVDGAVVIPKDKLSAAYRALVELNDHDELKIGGQKPEVLWDKAKDRWNPNRWFSWMPYDYPDKLKNAKDVLDAVGFDCLIDNYGSLVISYYNSKTGCEREFLNAIAPFVNPGCYLDWEGEERERWCNKFDGKTMKTVGIIVTYTEEEDNE
jgi:hypothetical protein